MFAKYFMELLKDSKIVNIKQIKGEPFDEASDCTFEVTTEDGISFLV